MDELIDLSRRAEYERYLHSPAWEDIKYAKRDRYWCVGCGRDRYLQLHHMIYPADIWDTKSRHCCWLCERCHETLHRAPAKYIAIAVTEGYTKMVIQAQRDEEAGMTNMRNWAATSKSIKELGLEL